LKKDGSTGNSLFLSKTVTNVGPAELEETKLVTLGDGISPTFDGHHSLMRTYAMMMGEDSPKSISIVSMALEEVHVPATKSNITIRARACVNDDQSAGLEGTDSLTGPSACAEISVEALSGGVVASGSIVSNPSGRDKATVRV